MVKKERRRVAWTVNEETIRLIKSAKKNAPADKAEGAIVDWCVEKMFKSRKDAILERIKNTDIERAWWVSQLKHYIEVRPEENDVVVKAILDGYDKK